MMENSVTVKYWFGDKDTYSFRDIVSFRYDQDCYYLSVLDDTLSWTTYNVGRNEEDSVTYGGVSYGVKDFPELTKIIHNRNIERALEDLE